MASRQPASQHSGAAEATELPPASLSNGKTEPCSVKAEQDAAESASQNGKDLQAEGEADVGSKPEPDMQAEPDPSQAAAELCLAAQMDAGAAGKLQEADMPCEQPAARDGGAAQPSAASQPAEHAVGSRSPHAAAASKRKGPVNAKPSPAKKSKGPGGRTAQISSYFTKNSA